MKETDKNRTWAIYEWIMENEKEGKKEYPDLHKHLTEVVDRISPYQEIQMIKSIISHFPNWINTINKLLPKARKNKIEEYYKIVYLMLYQKYPDKIVKLEIKKQKPFIEEMILFLNKEYEKFEEKKKGFNWTSNKDELHLIFEKLKENKLINKDETLERFIKIFNNKEISLSDKIQWMSQKNLLAYFIDQLLVKEKIPITTNLWATGKICFNGANNLAQLKENYLNNNSALPKNSHIIDSLF